LRLHGTLELTEANKPGMAFGVTIVDVCDGGVGLVCGGPLPVGARVSLAVQNWLLQGIVVHCHAGNGHYSAGVIVDHDCGVLARLKWLASLSPSGHPAANRAQTPATR
jgi:hypothetical protein